MYEDLKLYIDETARSAAKLRALGLPVTLLIDPEGRSKPKAGPASSRSRREMFIWGSFGRIHALPSEDGFGLTSAGGVTDSEEHRGDDRVPAWNSPGGSTGQPRLSRGVVQIKHDARSAPTCQAEASAPLL